MRLQNFPPHLHPLSKKIVVRHESFSLLRIASESRCACVCLDFTVTTDVECMKSNNRNVPMIQADTFNFLPPIFRM